MTAVIVHRKLPAVVIQLETKDFRSKNRLVWSAAINASQAIRLSQAKPKSGEQFAPSNLRDREGPAVKILGYPPSFQGQL